MDQVLEMIAFRQMSKIKFFVLVYDRLKEFNGWNEQRPMRTFQDRQYATNQTIPCDEISHPIRVGIHARNEDFNDNSS